MVGQGTPRVRLDRQAAPALMYQPWTASMQYSQYLLSLIFSLFTSALSRNAPTPALSPWLTLWIATASCFTTGTNSAASAAVRWRVCHF
jgi:hypothetical protein